MLFLKLAWRNILRQRRRTFIIIIAMGMSLMMMIFYDGFVAGFDQAIYANAVKVMGGNIQIHAPGYQAEFDILPLLPVENDQQIAALFKAQPNVLAAGRRINTGGMATNREGAFPLSIIAIEPGEEQTVNLAAMNVTAGRFLRDDDREAVFVGKGLADAMALKVGDRITLVGRSKHEQMRQRPMTVVGIYDVGLVDFEKRTAYITLADGQDLYGLSGQSTEIAVSLAKLGQEAGVLKALTNDLKGYEVGTWKTSYPELEEALSSKGAMMNLFNLIIMIIVGIGIFNLLMMAVYERTREIGLMGAMGMKPRQITLTFLLEGLLMGVISVLVGTAIGLALNLALGRVGFDFTAMSGMTEYMALLNSRIYPNLGIEKLPYHSAMVIIVSTLAAYYPSRLAATKEPAEALHYV